MDVNEAKYQYLVRKRKNKGFKYLKKPKVFIVYPINMQYFYKNIEEYNPDRECNVLIVFDDVIADTSSNKKF